MKRSSSLKRTPLSHGDTTLTRTPFPARHPAEVSATNFKSSPLAPGARRRRQRIPPNIRQRVLARSKRKCIVCHRRVRLQIHHCLAVQRWPELELEPDGMVGICEPCHDNHERAHRRIRWDELPACVITLAQTLGGRAVLELERHYPR